MELKTRQQKCTFGPCTTIVNFLHGYYDFVLHHSTKESKFNYIGHKIVLTSYHM